MEGAAYQSCPPRRACVSMPTITACPTQKQPAAARPRQAVGGRIADETVVGVPALT
jgi:hypothetical protein